MKPAEELENRLIDFASRVIDVVEGFSSSRAGNHIAGQLLRAGTSPAPNYGEARGAESRKDFLHKLKIALKELKETLVWLRILDRKGMGDREQVRSTLKECDELVAIFIASARTVESSGPSRG